MRRDRKVVESGSYLVKKNKQVTYPFYTNLKVIDLARLEIEDLLQMRYTRLFCRPHVVLGYATIWSAFS